MRLFVVLLLWLNLIGMASAQGLEEPSVSALKSDAKDVVTIANHHLAVMRDEIKHSAAKKSSFSLFGSSTTPLEVALLNDLNDYIKIYGQKSLSVEAIQLKAILHNRMDQNEALAMDFMTILSAYSGSRYEKASRKGLQNLLEDSLKYHKSVIDTVLNHDFASIPKQSERLFALLSDLSSVDDKDFNPVIAKACSRFLLRFPDNVHNDEVQLILAEHTGSHYHVGIYQYHRLLAVYPESNLRPDALFAIGEIQRSGLKHYEDAAMSYRQVIEQFPRSDIAKHAYIQLALTQSKHLRLYQEALLTLNTAVEKYADDAVGKEALQMLGDIYTKKTKEYSKAVDAYRKLSDIFSGDDGLQALQDAERIASKYMHDYALVIAIDEQLIRDYSESDLAPVKMLNIADVYNNKLKQPSEAIKQYQRVIESYPSSKQAKEASSEIRKIEKRKGGSSGLF